MNRAVLLAGLSIGVLPACGDAGEPDSGIGNHVGANTAVGQLSAHGSIGALNRVGLTLRDTDRDLCATLGLVQIPAIEETISVTVPEGWSVESAFVSRCSGDDHVWVQANDGHGFVDWADDDPFPREGTRPMLDVDAVISFPDAEAWVPGSVAFTAPELPIAWN